LSILGGLISRVGLVALGGSSSMELDAETTYTQPTGNHSSNHPVSTGWYSSIYGRDVPASSDSLTKHLCLVAGNLTGMGVDVSVNSRSEDHSMYFRVNSTNNLFITIPSSTTGSVIDPDLDLDFEKYDNIGYWQTGTGTGNLDHKFTSIIKWK
jgi:hypothetical protein